MRHFYAKLTVKINQLTITTFNSTGEWRYNSAVLNFGSRRELSPSNCPGRFKPCYGAPDTHWIGGCCGRCASEIEPVARRCTDWSKEVIRHGKVCYVQAVMILAECEVDIVSRKFNMCMYIELSWDAVYISEVISTAGRGSRKCCRKLRIPHFLDSGVTYDGQVVSLTRRPRFTPRKISGTHFW
jgi:hypothetical protein